jgi:hypothetical protein
MSDYLSTKKRYHDSVFVENNRITEKFVFSDNIFDHGRHHFGDLFLSPT